MNVKDIEIGDLIMSQRGTSRGLVFETQRLQYQYIGVLWLFTDGDPDAKDFISESYLNFMITGCDRSPSGFRFYKKKESGVYCERDATC